MKINRYIIAGACVLLLTACNNWLDVKPDNSVDEDKLFSTEQGFKDALAGVYADMGKGGLYGRDLTFGLLDVFGQLYDYEKMETVYHQFHYARDYHYDNDNLRAQINGIWYSMYAAIAEVNNILRWIDKRPEVLSEPVRHQVKGQCLFLRAYLHYDLLRLYAPNVKRAPDATGIPYVETFGVKPTPAMTVKSVIDKIKKDLDEARLELENDPIRQVVPYTFEDKTESDRYVARANYYAVDALLARILLDEGKYQEAGKLAASVIESGKFSLLDIKKSINVQKDSVDMLFSDEHIFSIRNKAIRDNARKIHMGISTDTSVSGAELPLPTNINELFDNNNDDVRLSTWVNAQNRYLVKYTNEEIEKFYPKQVLLKLSEMYLILAECQMHLGDAQALETLNTLRRSRMAKSAKTDKTKISEEVLIEEMRREFIGEGHMFYEYKRLNSPILNILKNFEPADNIQIFPRPENENEYGIYN